MDAALAADPAVDLERELGRADVVLCGAIGAGAVLASGIVRAGGLGLPPLVSPIVVCIVVQVVGLAALLVLMDEHRPRRGWVAAGRSVGTVPSVMGGALRTIRGSSLLATLVAAELLWGFGMVAFETFFPPRLAELTSGADVAAGLVGPVVAGAWVLSAVGAACGPCSSGGSGRPGPASRCGACTGPPSWAWAWPAPRRSSIAAYLASYWAHGATNPVHYGMVHRAAAAHERATVVSANSLAAQVGGAVSGIALARSPMPPASAPR